MQYLSNLAHIETRIKMAKRKQVQAARVRSYKQFFIGVFFALAFFAVTSINFNF